MFKKAKKHLLSSFMLCGMTAISMQAHSDEVCFVNMTNVPIEAGWVTGPFGEFPAASNFTGDHIVITPQRNAACMSIGPGQTTWGIYRVLGANGQPVWQGAWIAEEEKTFNYPNYTSTRGTAIIDIGNYALMVHDPVVGTLDFSLGFRQPSPFNSPYIGNFDGQNVRLSSVQKGNDGVYRAFFTN